MTVNLWCAAVLHRIQLDCYHCCGSKNGRKPEFAKFRNLWGSSTHPNHRSWPDLAHKNKPITCFTTPHFWLNRSILYPCKAQSNLFDQIQILPQFSMARALIPTNSLRTWRPNLACESKHIACCFMLYFSLVNIYRFPWGWKMAKDCKFLWNIEAPNPLNRSWSNFKNFLNRLDQ